MARARKESASRFNFIGTDAGNLPTTVYLYTCVCFIIVVIVFIAGGTRGVPAIRVARVTVGAGVRDTTGRTTRVRRTQQSVTGEMCWKKKKAKPKCEYTRREKERELREKTKRNTVARARLRGVGGGGGGAC